jgi:hypothetical protein
LEYRLTALSISPVDIALPRKCAAADKIEVKRLAPTKSV